jgi:hypothetical protein
MAKKSEEVKNELVNEVVETTAVPTQAPTQKVELEKTAEGAVSPGHATRAFRG